MIYSVMVTSVTFPEPLVDRRPGRISRSPEPVVISAIIQMAGKGKLKYIQVGKLVASIFQEGDYFAIVVHDGDYDGAKKIGEALKEYFRKITQEMRLPEEKEVLDVISFALLPDIEELEELLKILRQIDVEPMFQTKHIYERVSLFTALASAFRHAIKPASREKIIDKFFRGDFKFVVENVVTQLKDDILRAIFGKSVQISYISSPDLPLVEPKYVMKAVEKIEIPVVREYLKILLEYALGLRSHGDIGMFVNAHRKEIEELLEGENAEIFAAVFAYPARASRLYKRGVELLRDKSPYFYALYDSLIDLGKIIQAATKADVELAVRMQDITREKLVEAIKTGDMAVMSFRLYSNAYAGYLYLVNLLNDFEKSVRLASKIASLIPAAIVPLLSSKGAYPPAYTRVYSSLISLRTLTLTLEYYSTTNPQLLKNIVDIFVGPLKEFVEYARRRITAGRIPADQLVHLLSELAIFYRYFSSYFPDADKFSRSVAKALADLNVEIFRSLYQTAQENPSARYNRAEICSNIAILAALEYQRSYVDRVKFEKALHIIERLVLHASISTDLLDKLTPVIPLYALLKYFYRNGQVSSSEVFPSKFASVKNIVYRIPAPPVAKFLLYKELYDLAKAVGAMAEELREIYNSRHQYVESVNGDPSLVDKLK